MILEAEFLENEQLDRRRRAIFIALRECMDDDQAIKGTQIWLDDFSNKPLYALQPFMTRVFSEFNLAISRAVLQKQLLASLMRAEDDMPELSRQNNRNASANKKVMLPNAHFVFTFLMDYLQDEVRKYDPDKELSIKINVFDNTHKIGITGKVFDNIKQWLSGNGQVDLIEQLTMQQMQSLFHYYYKAACEYIGPVITDQLVSESVRVVEQLPESSDCSPRKFF